MNLPCLRLRCSFKGKCTAVVGVKEERERVSGKLGIYEFMKMWALIN